MSPLEITLKTSLAATLITSILGLALARLVVGMKRGKGIADAIIMLPLVLPPTVVGFFMLVLFGKRSVVGQMLLELGMRFIFTWEGTVIAAAVVSLPLMYRAGRGALEQVDRNIIDAARTLGVSDVMIFLKIEIPNALGGIMAGIILSYTRAMGEFGATMMLAGNVPGETQTLSTAIYAAVQANDYELAMKWAIILSLLSLVFIYGMNCALKKH